MSSHTETSSNVVANDAVLRDDRLIGSRLLIQRIERLQREREARLAQRGELHFPSLKKLKFYLILHIGIIFLIFGIFHFVKRQPIEKHFVGKNAMLFVGSEWYNQGCNIYNYDALRLNTTATNINNLNQTNFTLPEPYDYTNSEIEEDLEHKRGNVVDVITNEDVKNSEKNTGINQYNLFDNDYTYPIGFSPLLELNESLSFRRTILVAGRKSSDDPCSRIRLWFAVGCPENEKGNQWSLKCSNSFPENFDIAVIAKMAQFYIPATVLRVMPLKNKVAFHRVEKEIRQAKNIRFDARPLTPEHTDIAFSNTIEKTCDNALDECQSSTFGKYTNSYKMISDSSMISHVPYDNMKTIPATRMLAFLPGVSGLWGVELENYLDPSLQTEVELTVLVVPHKRSFNPLFTLFMSMGFAVIAVSFLILIKLAGIYCLFGAADPSQIIPSIVIDSSDILSGSAEEMVQSYHILIFQIRRNFKKLIYWIKRRCIRCRNFFWRRWRRTRSDRIPLFSQDRGELGVEMTHPTNQDSNNENCSNQMSADRSHEKKEESDSFSLSSDDDDDVDICRICRVKEPEADLISPCVCSGTSKYVHKQCLQRWREMTRNPIHREKCAECKTPYTVPFGAAPEEEQHRPMIVRVGRGLGVFIVQFFIIFFFPIFIFVFGYLLKFLALIITFDSHIYWGLDMYHFVCGWMAMAVAIWTLNNCTNAIQEFRSNLFSRLPLLLGITIFIPIILGASVTYFFMSISNALPTPELFYVSGSMIFILLGAPLSTIFPSVERWRGIRELYEYNQDNSLPPLPSGINTDAGGNRRIRGVQGHATNVISESPPPPLQQHASAQETEAVETPQINSHTTIVCIEGNEETNRSDTEGRQI